MFSQPLPDVQCNINVIKCMSFSIFIIILRLICTLCVFVYDIYDLISTYLYCFHTTYYFSWVGKLKNLSKTHTQGMPLSNCSIVHNCDLYIYKWYTFLRVTRVVEVNIHWTRRNLATSNEAVFCQIFRMWNKNLTLNHDNEPWSRYWATDFVWMVRLLFTQQ